MREEDTSTFTNYAPGCWIKTYGLEDHGRAGRALGSTADIKYEAGLKDSFGERPNHSNF